MEAPVMSKIQAKKTLSNKKGKKETVKIMLSNPYSQYNPLLKASDAESLNESLTYLPKLNPDKVKIPISAIKNVPKAERKAIRAQYIKKIDIDLDVKSNLIFGINEVTKLLEKKQAGAVLLAAETNPQFMIRHVIDLSVLQNVPVLLVPKLKDTLKTTVGIASACVGIKKDLNENSKLLLIYEKINLLSLNYPVPDSFMHYKNETVQTDSEENESLDQNMQNLELNKINGSSNKKKIDFYLYRKDNTSRIFVPELSKETNGSKMKMEVDDSGFIGFSDSVKIETPKINYQGLKVKRVRNNKDRMKKIKMNF